MSQELLQAVLENPDQDAPRLAYAGWCDQQTAAAEKARSEFIRIEILMANETENFRISPDGQRLRLRSAQLKTEFGGIWTESIQSLVARAVFRRGFVEFVTMTAANLMRHGDQLLALAPVRHIDLTHVRDVDERLFVSPSLAGLLSLGMQGCGLYTIHVRLLFASGVSAKLRWLSLEHNRLDIGAAEAIAQSPYSKNLEYVIFAGNPVDPTEQMGWDSGALISVWMPPEGEELEQRFGPLAWLRRTNGPIARYEP